MTIPMNDCFTEGVDILPMTKNDIDAVSEIERRVFSTAMSKNQFNLETERNFSFPFVLKFRNLVVGYAICWLIETEAQLIQIAIDRAFRSQHLGTALLHIVIQEMKKRGAEGLYLEVRRSNVAAQKLYRKFGFRIVGERPNYYVQEKEDALLMHLHF